MSETYAKKILGSTFFEGAGSADRYQETLGSSVYYYIPSIIITLVINEYNEITLQHDTFQGGIVSITH